MTMQIKSQLLYHLPKTPQCIKLRALKYLKNLNEDHFDEKHPHLKKIKRAQNISIKTTKRIHAGSFFSFLKKNGKYLALLTLQDEARNLRRIKSLLKPCLKLSSFQAAFTPVKIIKPLQKLELLAFTPVAEESLVLPKTKFPHHHFPFLRRIKINANFSCSEIAEYFYQSCHRGSRASFLEIELHLEADLHADVTLWSNVVALKCKINENTPQFFVKSLQEKLSKLQTLDLTFEKNFQAENLLSIFAKNPLLNTLNLTIQNCSSNEPLKLQTADISPLYLTNLSLNLFNIPLEAIIISSNGGFPGEIHLFPWLRNINQLQKFSFNIVAAEENIYKWQTAIICSLLENQKHLTNVILQINLNTVSGLKFSEQGYDLDLVAVFDALNCSSHSLEYLSVQAQTISFNKSQQLIYDTFSFPKLREFVIYMSKMPNTFQPTQLIDPSIFPALEIFHSKIILLIDIFHAFRVMKKLAQMKSLKELEISMASNPSDLDELNEIFDPLFSIKTLKKLSLEVTTCSLSQKEVEQFYRERKTQLSELEFYIILFGYKYYLKKT